MITDRRLRIYAFNGGCVEEAVWSDIHIRLANLVDFAEVWRIPINLVQEVLDTLGRLEQTEETK